MANENGSRLRPRLLGEMTRRAVIEALQSGGALSRAEITRLTGISATTVSSAVALLLRDGLVEEGELPTGGLGRPGRRVRLASQRTQWIGVSVAPRECELARGGLDGERLEATPMRFPTPSAYGALLDAIERRVREQMDRPGVRTLGFGVSLPGRIDRDGQQALFSPNLHYTDGRRPAEDLAQRLGIRATLIQESEALVLAEQRALRVDDLAILDYTGGLGIGVLNGGRSLGRQWGLPCELGHITVEPQGEPCGCGNRGCLETVATDAAFLRDIARGGALTTMAEALGHDNSMTRSALDKFLDYLAIAVAAIIHLFGAPLIVLHGELLRAKPALLPELESRVRRRVMAVGFPEFRLVISHASKAHGALVAALDQHLQSLGPRLPETG